MKPLLLLAVVVVALQLAPTETAKVRRPGTRKIATTEAPAQVNDNNEDEVSSFEAIQAENQDGVRGYLTHEYVEGAVPVSNILFDDGKQGSASVITIGHVTPSPPPRENSNPSGSGNVVRVKKLRLKSQTTAQPALADDLSEDISPGNLESFKVVNSPTQTPEAQGASDDYKILAVPMAFHGSTKDEDLNNILAQAFGRKDRMRLKDGTFRIVAPLAVQNVPESVKLSEAVRNVPKEVLRIIPQSQIQLVDPQVDIKPLGVRSTTAAPSETVFRQVVTTPTPAPVPVPVSSTVLYDLPLEYERVKQRPVDFYVQHPSQGLSHQFKDGTTQFARPTTPRPRVLVSTTPVPVTSTVAPVQFVKAFSPEVPQIPLHVDTVTIRPLAISSTTTPNPGPNLINLVSNQIRSKGVSRLVVTSTIPPPVVFSSTAAPVTFIATPTSPLPLGIEGNHNVRISFTDAVITKARTPKPVFTDVPLTILRNVESVKALPVPVSTISTIVPLDKVPAQSFQFPPQTEIRKPIRIDPMTAMVPPEHSMYQGSSGGYVDYKNEIENAPPSSIPITENYPMSMDEYAPHSDFEDSHLIEGDYPSELVYPLLSNSGKKGILKLPVFLNPLPAGFPIPDFDQVASVISETRNKILRVRRPKKFRLKNLRFKRGQRHRHRRPRKHRPKRPRRKPRRRPHRGHRRPGHKRRPRPHHHKRRPKFNVWNPWD